MSLKILLILLCLFKIDVLNQSSLSAMDHEIKHLSIHKNVKQEQTEAYNYTIKHPVFTSYSTISMANLNNLIKNVTQAELDSFITRVTSSENFNDSTNELHISYKIMYNSAPLISILFSIDSYYAGAAHGNTRFISLTYDTDQNKKLALSDLFTADSLPIIANYCNNALKPVVASDNVTQWLDEGTAPIGTNYQHWNLVPKGLLITFEAYQVAAYCYGPQEVIVPYHILEPFITTEGKHILNSNYSI